MGEAIVRSTAMRSRSATPFPFRSQTMGSFWLASHWMSFTSVGAAGFEMSKMRTPPRGAVPAGLPPSPV